MRLDPVEEARRSPSSYRSGYPEMLEDDEIVLLTRRDFDRLDDYNGSRPTGVCVGKVWRTGHRDRDPTEHGNFALGTFRECDPPEEDAVLTVMRPLVVVE